VSSDGSENGIKFDEEESEVFERVIAMTYRGAAKSD